MTKKNKKICSFVIVSIGLFLFVPLKIVQFLGLSIVCVIAFSFAYSNILRKSIVVERQINKLKIACREKVEISLIIKNNSKLTAHIFYFMDEAPYLMVYDHKNTDIVTLHPKEYKKCTYSFSAQERGLYKIGPVKIRASDPIGLFDFEIEVENILEVTVRPQRIKLIAQAFPGLPQGRMKINNAIYEDITQRKNIREYMNGDEQRRINWRMTAKQNELYTNVYENTFDTNFFIFLNLAEEDYDLHSRYYDMEKAIQIAACIVEKARELHQPVGFAAYGTDFPYIRPSQNQYDNILDILSLIKMEPGKLEYEPYNYYKSLLPNGTIFFIIGQKEVTQYFAKVEASQEDINTENIGVLRREYVTV